MGLIITPGLVEAYSHCPRKAFLLMTGGSNPGPNEYQQIIAERATENTKTHRHSLPLVSTAPFCGPADLLAGREVLTAADLTSNGLQARCDFLSKAKGSTGEDTGYEPVMAIGTRRAERVDILGLAYQGLVLGQIQGRVPTTGTLIRLGGRPLRVKLSPKYKEINKIIETLRSWSNTCADGPPVVLNKHCQSCPFRASCRQQAEKDDSLSLLDRMTPRLMRKYQEKGIFTVSQLSHLFKPRRSRKGGNCRVAHSLELQALAIRTGKIYIENLPRPPRATVEMFLDLEGIPDHNSYYLAGLLVCRGDEVEYYYFWADDEKGEAGMWSKLIDQMEAIPDAPVYHYGSYEGKATATLARRYGKGDRLQRRLVNLASLVYGKVYFPARSNSLKTLGPLLGAAWSDPLASGLQSLAWRHRWEETRGERCKQSLLQYNREDCEAVRLLLHRLDRLGREASSDPGVEFARCQKRYCTEAGTQIHNQFESILESAHERNGGRGIHIRNQNEKGSAEARKRGARKGHVTYHRIIPSKANRVIRVQPKRSCPRGHGDLTLSDKELASRTVTDLVFTRNGCRKTVRRVEGKKGHCAKCGRFYDPPGLTRLGNQMFGHAFQAWTIYQRVVLRLPYRIIAQVTEHLFGVGLSPSTGINFLRYLADYYISTEEAMLLALRQSNFLHADETKISIQGTDHYVWVVTDGKHVVFRLTPTRETDVIRDMLKDYQGVLVTDFYPGYDSMPCLQQKCLIHLIRDINDDLWKSPFDRELEDFALGLKSLLVPLLEDVERYGLKVRHLQKHERRVEQFYLDHITSRDYKSEHAITYQKRFIRYRKGLFTFLQRESIPWNNNMAERAIRQLAVQRKISGSFFEKSANHYLLLLAIAQTCRFQGKSFLKFLLSGKKNIDAFPRAKPLQYSYPTTLKDVVHKDE